MEGNSNVMNGGSPVKPFIIEGLMTQPARQIRIIDGHYKLQFLVEDGGYIRADGKLYQLHYLDETHFAVNSPNGNCWHICQFGECVIDKGTKVEKADKGE